MSLETFHVDIQGVETLQAFLNLVNHHDAHTTALTLTKLTHQLREARQILETAIHTQEKTP